MNKKICIVTDLDGTFFNKDSVPAQSNIEAVERLKAAGHYFTIATGRYFIKWSMYANAPIILCNGAVMVDTLTDTTVNRHAFDGRELYATLESVHGKFPDSVVRYTDSRGIHYLNFDGKDDIGDGWYKVVYESRHTDIRRDTQYKRADLSDIYECICGILGDSYRCNFSAPTLLEILQNGVSKGTAIGDLKRYFAERGEDVTVYAAGDYENDIEMLTAADIAVCPSNALPLIREMIEKRASYDGSAFVAADNNSGTIADIINHLFEDGKLS